LANSAQSGVKPAGCGDQERRYDKGRRDLAPRRQVFPPGPVQWGPARASSGCAPTRVGACVSRGRGVSQLASGNRARIDGPSTAQRINVGLYVSSVPIALVSIAWLTGILQSQAIRPFGRIHE